MRNWNILIAFSLWATWRMLIPISAIVRYTFGNPERSNVVKKLILALCGILMLSAQMAWGQAFAPNEAGVTMGHWHLNTRNIEATRKIFLAMGGTEVQGDNARVRFPGVLVILREQTPTGGTVGSVVNHVGFMW
jgi:heme A synthase